MQQQQQKRPLRSEWIFKHGFSLRWLQLHLPPFLNGGIKILAAASRKLLCKERTSFKVKANAIDIGTVSINSAFGSALGYENILNTIKIVLKMLTKNAHRNQLRVLKIESKTSAADMFVLRQIDIFFVKVNKKLSLVLFWYFQ